MVYLAKIDATLYEIAGIVLWAAYLAASIVAGVVSYIRWRKSRME